jgi:glycosyltransferase involved in cell wall biosynthesis
MINISIISLHCVKHDAISNVMKTYSDWIRNEPRYQVKCYGYHSEYSQEELPFQKIEQNVDLLLDAHFQNSHIVIFQYGIYYQLMDLVGLAPVHAKVITIFHNVTPKEFVAPQHHALIDRSFAQIQNMQLVDFVACDSPTNLKTLRAHGVRTPAAILPLWFKKIYGTPSSKPSFLDRITRIAFIGRFVRSKGPLDLLSALELYLKNEITQKNALEGLQLSIICNKDHSEPVLLAEAQKQALEMERVYGGKLRIKFLFNVNDAQKFQELQDADIFALPTYHEGFCVPILEALSNGCRIVAYNNSNVPFVAGHEAHLAETGNIASLAGHLKIAIEMVNAVGWRSVEQGGSYAQFINRHSQHLAEFSSGFAQQRLFNLFDVVRSVNHEKLPQVCNLLEETKALALSEYIQIKRPLGVNVLGFISGILGLGEAARAMIQGLSAHATKAWPLELIDLRVPQLPLGKDLTFDNFASDFKYAINLTMMNPKEHEHAMIQYGMSKFQGRYNIGLWYWELVDVLPEWRTGAKLIDELWVTTNYIYDNLVHFSRVPVHKVTIPIIIDTNKINASRTSLGLPENTFLFVFAFDQNSVMSRKNPMSVIEAYRLAFGDRKDVGLVVKTINSDKQPQRQAELNEAIKDLNAFIVDGELDRYQTLSLYAACDSYVSLHRAEGLGLAMAESMYLGKPVIATGYSGNMEFMNHHNSLPVKYQLVEIQEDQNLYRKGQWWAEPDIAHAAECMLSLVQAPDLCAKLGARAKEHIQTHFSVEKAQESMHGRLEEIVKTRGKVLGFIE